MSALASNRVWRLVSGLPKGKRERRRLAVFVPQAFIDDSGNQPSLPYFVLGGFVSSVNNWALFSDEWRAALDLEPKLDYFKMNEANLLIEQFGEARGWTSAKRDKRLDVLSGIIKKYALIRIHASVRHADFAKYVASCAAPERTLLSDNPYIYLLIKMVMAMAIRSTVFGINESCDFIFDEQCGFSEEVFIRWPVFKSVVESRRDPKFPMFLGSRPKFESDRDFAPLQAADLFAGQMRFYKEQNVAGATPPNDILRKLLEITAIEHDTSESDMEILSNKIEQVSQLYIEKNPSTMLVHMEKSKGKRKRQRRKSRRGAIRS
jgi:hypothetical protein